MLPDLANKDKKLYILENEPFLVKMWPIQYLEYTYTKIIP